MDVITVFLQYGVLGSVIVGFVGWGVVRGVRKLMELPYPPRTALPYIDPHLSTLDRLQTEATISPAHAANLATYLGFGYDRELAEVDAKRLRLEEAEREARKARRRARRAAEQAAETRGLPPVAPIPFKDNEPRTLAAFTAHYPWVDFIRKAIHVMPRERARLEKHELFVGPAGLGKTTLAKCVAQALRSEMEARGKATPDFILTVGTLLDTKAKLDATVRRAAAREGSVLFIDEFHTIVRNGFGDQLLRLLLEHSWQFDGEANPTDLPEFTILAGTTDWGALTEAMRRRFNVRHLRPLSRAALRDILASQRTYPITAEAIDRVLDVTHWDGAPYACLDLHTNAMVLARYHQHATIQVGDVEEVIRVHELDPLGLRPVDRAVLTALLSQPRLVKGRRKGEPDETVYVASEPNLVQIARVDAEAYASDIRPRLMARGLLGSTSRGQQLTAEGITHAQRS